MIEFTINFKALKAVQLFASKDKNRDSLRGVHVEFTKAKGLTLVATDGRTLLAYHPSEIEYQKSDQDISFTVPSELLNLVRIKAPISLNCFVSYDSKEKTVKLKDIVTGYSFAGGVVDGTFPNWRMVIPNPNGYKTGALSQFNPDFLLKFQTASDLVADGHPYVRMWDKIQAPQDFTDFTIPICITNTTDEFLGVMMPLRGTYSHKLNFPWI